MRRATRVDGRRTARMNEGLAARIAALIQGHPTFGYRRLWALLRFREGQRITPKTVYRICALKGWFVHQRQTTPRARETDKSEAESHQIRHRRPPGSLNEPDRPHRHFSGARLPGSLADRHDAHQHGPTTPHSSLERPGPRVAHAAVNARRTAMWDDVLGHYSLVRIFPE